MSFQKEAKYYIKKEQSVVECKLCPHMCIIKPGQKGRCNVRMNEQGKLIAIGYGRVASYGKDPIEKKPLYHYFPGSKIFSVGSYGCNFTCDFCQNYGIAQNIPPIIETSPQNLVDIAVNEKDNLGIAYTYNEPTIWYEFMYDIAKEVRKAEKKNVMVTNGYMNIEPLKDLLPLIDAMNIDLKSMRPEFYKKYCGGELEPVKAFIKESSQNCHIEITTLLIEGLNTSEVEMKELCEFIASVSPEIPLHLSRYFPAYKMNIPSTPVEVMEKMKLIAEKYLKYVYIGNVPELNRNTYCSSCGHTLVERGLKVNSYITDNGHCRHCGSPSPVIVE